MTARVVVTGGAGFIGTAVVDRLRRQGHDLVVIDDLSGDSPSGKLCSVPVLTFPVQDTDRVASCCDEETTVIHLASSVLIRGGEKDTRQDLDQALLGTRSVLEACRRSGVRRFCFASSASVYGHQSGPLPETAPLVPRSLYGACKAGAEALIHAYGHLFGVDTCIFRFGNVQGPGLRRGVVWDFVSRLAANPGELLVLGDGQQRKSYLALSDCAAAVVELGLTGTGQRVFNLSAGGSVPVTTIATMAATAMGLEPRLSYTGGSTGWPGDVPVIELDSGRARKAGWLPRHSAEEALKQSIMWAVSQQ